LHDQLGSLQPNINAALDGGSQVPSLNKQLGEIANARVFTDNRFARSSSAVSPQTCSTCPVVFRVEGEPDPNTWNVQEWFRRSRLLHFGQRRRIPRPHADTTTFRAAPLGNKGGNSLGRRRPEQWWARPIPASTPSSAAIMATAVTMSGTSGNSVINTMIGTGADGRPLPNDGNSHYLRPRPIRSTIPRSSPIALRRVP
jgi:hypothetical protein